MSDAGRLPASAGKTLQVSASSGNPSADTITQVLTSRGFTIADPADYLVQIVSSDLPAKTGAYLPESTPDASGRQAWLTAPSHSRTIQTRRVTITLTDIATGREAYRASGVERYRANQPGSSDALIEALVDRMTQQTAISTVPPEGGAT
ncbi:DUF4136 domain-containing protein [Sphingobium aromaticiconvertens]|uniref:DUF4136 domain-containing protein n=1 Tax=Sphingobium aromaticiconvertens TaxID=365341 RepID=UPI003018E199